MSTLESIIWHILGYAAMPMIFIFGFIGVALVSLLFLHLRGVKPVEDGETL
ncbi:TIGR02808 family protein [Echinimonas agarilytica]|uniref:TIGR02808 family protein n=1 Tax=Echinimonas agarilytica TaxID=1215918 RepID=A0AA41W611_9GAMM|nr:TIGR02808 family protein [Echinimonas agarilytica]MCM2679729.1 TIGR02808 family protein [Echinimonas agarilytica]